MEYQAEKIRYISHEVKNQLSICDLYTEILQKYCEKTGIKDETVKKSIDSIKRAVQLAGNSLIELKTEQPLDMQLYSANELISESYELAKVYASAIGVNVEISLEEEYKIYADKNRLEGTLINLIKNACEAFTDDIKDKKIKIYTQKQDNILNIIVSNNAKPIEDKEAIFNDGYTTKKTGSGLGLYICKKNMEEMSGSLKLLKSDKVSTDFSVQLKQ